MTALRLVAIALIFVVATVAWVVLAGSVQYRTDTSDNTLGTDVAGLWGAPQYQTAPTFTYRPDGEGAALPLAIAGSDITTRFDLDQRRKGLLWYATYAVDFDATYRVVNPGATAAQAQMRFPFPTYDGVYDGFGVIVNGTEVPVVYAEGAATAAFDLPAKGTAEVRAGYRTQGLDEWRYVPTENGVGVINDFSLAAETDFADVDYPADTVSPTTSKETDAGMQLTWEYESLVGGRAIGILMPQPTNPGPLVARISLFAPVSLLFFFAALVLLSATGGLRLHPVHYAFLAAGFFSFHLLLAYLADHIDINAAFGIAAIVSVTLCVGYLALVLGRNRVLVEIALSQLIFLVLFSYSFFFEGLTGIAITIGSVLTLAFFMVKTAHVDWERVFARQGKPLVPQPAQAPAAPTADPASRPGG